MKFKVLQLDKSAIVPRYANPSDVGLDLFSIVDAEIEPGESKLIKTGIAIEILPGFEATVRPRSGLALKHQITVLNTPGTIDAGYRGEIGVILINHGKETFQVARKMKIAQLVISPVVLVELEVVESLSESERGSGGFGSTGY